ncbi:phosphotransferase [Nocardia sp. NPDC019395]|uniref:phosphotransferase n=1 Tax=Nocardia sp. NPDC019395 TaxID=3154686 RepID=UPI00340DF080
MEDPVDVAVIAGPDDLTAEWLTATLGTTVLGFRSERIGTGQVSDCYRVTVDRAPGSTGPRSVILKVASADPTSRQTGSAMGLYESEVRFYRELVPHLRGGPIPACYHAAIDTDSGAFDLVLEDAAPAVVGDEILGATAEQAFLAAAELGRLHRRAGALPSLTEAAWLDRSSLLNAALFEQLYTLFLDRYREYLTGAQRSVCDALVAGFDHYLELVSGDRRGLVHGDYRLDNMLFGAPDAGRSLTVVDWQGVMAGPALTDLAYFLGGALTTGLRRTHYADLLRSYHAALGPNPPITLAQVRESVRRQSFMGVIMSIAASVVVERTERGDELFMTTLSRHCDHVTDTGAPDLLAPADDISG